MYYIFIVILTFCVAVNGVKRPKDLGHFNSQVHVGESLTSVSSMRDDSHASSNVQQKLNDLAKGYAIEALGLDPIRRKDITFSVPILITRATIKLTKFVATGAKYLIFEQTAVYRNYYDDSFRIDLTASTPILATKCHFSTSYSIIWEFKLSGHSNVFLEHVRLQIAALLRPKPSRDGSGRKIYQVVGLDMNIDVDNVRIIISTSDELPMSPDEIVEKSGGRIFKMVAEAIVTEVNSLLEKISLNQVLEQ